MILWMWWKSRRVTKWASTQGHQTSTTRRGRGSSCGSTTSQVECPDKIGVIPRRKPWTWQWSSCQQSPPNQIQRGQEYNRVLLLHMPTTQWTLRQDQQPALLAMWRCYSPSSTSGVWTHSKWWATFCYTFFKNFYCRPQWFLFEPHRPPKNTFFSHTYLESWKCLEESSGCSHCENLTESVHSWPSLLAILDFCWMRVGM